MIQMSIVPDDVAVLHGAEVGYAVANAVIHRGADRLGESTVVERRRVHAEVHARVKDELVNII